MADAQLIYPVAAIAMGNGDLQQVTNFRISYKTGAKQKHTQRRRAAGIVYGLEETEVSWDFEIDEDGPERDYWGMAQKKQIKQVRAKVPGKTFTINGGFSSVDLDAPLDDAAKGSATMIGKLER